MCYRKITLKFTSVLIIVVAVCHYISYKLNPSEKMRKQGHRGVVLKPVKCWLCRDVTKTKNFFLFKNQPTYGQ